MNFEEKGRQIVLPARPSCSVNVRPLTIISFLLIFFLSVDSLPLPIRAQVIPLTSLLALLFLPFIINRINLTPLLKMVIAFVGFVMIHSIFALLLDFAVQEKDMVRLIAWIKQVTALAAGLAVFFVLRTTLVNKSDRFIIHTAIIGALPALGIASLNVLWGLNMSHFAGTIVTKIRNTLIPLGWTHPSRASGLSLEPSSFAVYLAIIVIPLIFAMLLKYSPLRKFGLVIFAIVILVFTWTFSLVGITVLFTTMVAAILLGPKRKTFLAICLISIGILVLWLHFFPHSYVVNQIRLNLRGQYTISFIDRFYSTFSPFISAFSSYTILGYGLGGTVTHFAEIIPKGALAAIMQVRWEEMPMLGTLIGRILAETGIFGLLLFALMILVSFRELQIVFRKENEPSKKLFLLHVRLALIGTLFAYAITLGSFAYPYLWFWLAVIDSRYMMLTKLKKI